MTPYDAAMIGVVVAGMVWGAWRGITWQLASIASLILGYVFAHPLSAQIAPHFPGEPVVARALAMLAAYALVSGGVFAIAWLIRATLRQLKFEAYDRHMGMILGGVEGAMVGIVVTLFVSSLAPSTREPIFTSQSGQVVGRVMDAVGPVLPTEVRQAITPHWAHVRPGVFKDPFGSIARSNPRDLREPTDLRELVDESRERLGRAAGKAVERGVEEGDTSGLRDLYDEGREVLGRAAEKAVGREGTKGETSSLRELVDEGRSRLGRAAAQALDRELRRAGDSDERTTRRR